MTKEITKAYILQQIQDKLGLRELVPGKFSFDESVVPIYNIEQHLRIQKAAYSEVSITSATGFVFFTVPADEKWFINGYNVIFMGSGAIKVAGVYVTRKSYATVFTYIDLTKNQAISYANYFITPISLGSGDKLSINVDEYTSTQNLRLYIDYMVEKIR